MRFTTQVSPFVMSFRVMFVTNRCKPVTKAKARKTGVLFQLFATGRSAQSSVFVEIQAAYGI
jgi:hypothetical protein